MRRSLTRLAALPPTLRQILQKATSGQSAASPTTVQGWIKSIRAHKSVSFLEITDGTTSETLQAVVKTKKVEGTELPGSVDGLSTGTSVKLQGQLQKSRGAGQAYELLVSQLSILGGCDASYPIQKKHLPPDVLRDHAHLRFRTSQIASTIRLRDTMMREWHEYFEDRDYTFIHTPIMTSSDCEGAGETFRISTDPMPSATPPTTSSVTPTPPNPPFFPSPAYLTVSSQLHLEAPTHAVSRTYTLSPTFRAEPSATSRHLAEFYMLEAEVAFVKTLDQLMSTVEDGIRAVVEGLVADGRRRSRRAKEDLRVIEHSLQQDREEKQRNSLSQDATSAALEIDPISRLRQMTDRPFIRISYTDAVSILQEQHSVTPFEHVPEWGASLQTEHEKYLAGEKFGAPVFVTDYPQTLKPFYMRLNDDTSAAATPSPTVACFDLLVPGIGELIGGSLREERLPHLERAISHAGLDKEAYEWYLDLRRYGSVKHGGWGMGWERFVCWVTGVGNIRDVVAFPRWKGNCKY